MHQRRDTVLKLENKNEELPVNYCFKKVAQFRAEPEKGRLLPRQEKAITISFQAHNFGVFTNQMDIELLGGLY